MILSPQPQWGSGYDTKHLYAEYKGWKDLWSSLI